MLAIPLMFLETIFDLCREGIGSATNISSALTYISRFVAVGIGVAANTHCAPTNISHLLIGHIGVMAKARKKSDIRDFNMNKNRRPLPS